MVSQYMQKPYLEEYDSMEDGPYMANIYLLKKQETISHWCNEKD